MAGEELPVAGAPTPMGELWKSPRRGVSTRSLCSPCLESAFFVLLNDSLSEETVDEDEEDEVEWLLVPDDWELRLRAAFAFRSSLRFLRSSALCFETSDVLEVWVSPANDGLTFPWLSWSSCLPSEVLSFLSGDLSAVDAEGAVWSAFEEVVRPSMTSSCDSLALRKASALDERAFLTGCGACGWLAAADALPLPDP